MTSNPRRNPKTIIKVTKEVDLDYRGHAEPKVGDTGWIDNQCREEQAKYGHMIRTPGATYVKFPAKTLGYSGTEPIKIWLPRDYFEEV